MKISPFPSPWLDRFKDLAVVQILTNKMSDDDVEAHGDLTYWRSLLNDVIDRVYCDHYQPDVRTALSLFSDLDAFETALEALRRHPDPPGELLARWKQDGPGVRQHPEA